jgi:arylsulfatase A-like enzyme
MRVARHVRCAAVTGLIWGGALGLAEVAIGAAQPRSRGIEPVDALIGALIYAALAGTAAATLGAVVGLRPGAARPRRRGDGLPRRYAAAGLFLFPLALAGLEIPRHAAPPPLGALALLFALATGAALAPLALRLRAPHPTLPLAAALVLAGVVAAVAALTTGRLGGSGTPASPQRAAPAPAAAPMRPNVVLVTVDTLRGDHIGACGDPVAQTRSIDALAAGGVLSCRVVTPQHQTNAAHAALFTGTAPNTNGVRRHMVDRLRPDLPTLAEVLRAQGYATGAIYSWVSLAPAFSGLDRGFEAYEGHVINRPAALENPVLQEFAALYRRLKERFRIVEAGDLVLNASGSLEAALDGRADLTTEAALRWLDRQGDRPFFLWVHYYDPHYPYAPPAPFDRMHDAPHEGGLDGSLATVSAIQAGALQLAHESPDTQRLVALYRGEIAFADQQIGRLLGWLDARGLAGDTLVVLTADHGESFGEHGAWFHPASVHDTEVAVPLVLSFPGRLPAGQLAAPISLLDIMPTVLDLLGIATPPSVEGESLVPLIDGRADGRDRVVFSQSFDDGLVTAVGADWKLIANTASGQTELYRLSPNPAEEMAAADAWSTLAGALTAWMEVQGIPVQHPLRAPDSP